jgi:hypothetical protein
MRQYIGIWNSKVAYDSVTNKVLYSIVIVVGVPIKPVRLIKMCLNETNFKVHIGKHLSDNFPAKSIVAYLSHARTVEPQKPRNTHPTIELRVFLAGF